MSTIDRSNYPGIPDDFPIAALPVTLPGAQPKLSVVKVGERFYPLGTSPREVQEDYASMLDLANQVVAYVHQNELTTQTALDEFLKQESMVMQMHFGVRAIHADWVVKQVRQLLREAGHPGSLESTSTSSSNKPL